MADEIRRTGDTIPSLLNRKEDVELTELRNAVDKVPDGEISQVQGGSVPSEDSRWTSLPRWKQTLVMLGLFLGLFFSVLDTSIVATALVAVLEDFDNFTDSPWIVLAYMLTYMSFAMVFARMSDIYGRKAVVAASWILFTAFSLACGLAQSMLQLIIFRAFQGLGGSGLYSMTMVLIPEVVPPEKMSIMSGLIAGTLACSGFLGPVLGGLISNYTTWRWIFFINVPIGVFVIVSIFVCWPRTTGHTFSKVALYSIDVIGVLLILSASILHTYGFEAAGSLAHEWNSPIIIGILVVSACSWVMFIIWEILLEMRKDSKVLPIFPIRIIRKRVMASAVVSTFLTGFPYITSIVTLPERFQLVNNLTSLQAGTSLLPLLVFSALGSFIGGALSSKRNNTSYTLIFASIFQLLGVALLSTLEGTDTAIPARMYVYAAILGLGVGTSLSSATIMTTIQADRRDLAAAQGAIAQLRILGGIIGLTIATTLFNRRSDAALSSHLSPAQLSALHKSPLAALSFTAEEELFVRGVYASVFAVQMRVLTFISAVGVVVSLFSWERHPGTMAERYRAGQLEAETETAAEDK